MKRFGKVKLIALAMAAILAFSVVPSIPAQAKDRSSAIAVGIDVSRYQGNIDWNAVAASGVTFAFIRVGTLNTGIDPYFAQNMVGAAAAGIKTGVYIYSGATDFVRAQQEAAFVLSAIEPYIVSMPVVIDMETSYQRNVPAAQLSAVANYFCMLIEASGYYPMVYSNKWFFSNRLNGVVYDKWVAQYYSSCLIEDAAVWQCMDTWRVPGIAGNVDLDYLYKDYSKLIIANGFINRKGATYFYENYKMKKDAFVTDGVNLYYVNEFGQRVENTFYVAQGAIRYFGKDGVMAIGLQNIAGSTFFFDTAGKLMTGMQDFGIGKFYFDPLYAGAMSKGWFTVDGASLNYADKETGMVASGLVTVDGKLYFFDPANGDKLKVGTGAEITMIAGVPCVIGADGVVTILQVPQTPVTP
ncbi:MAG: hypothetical protein K6G57_08565 [Lachnospiraceae bacterium]|nr:hypothetical protein [Lachnospiraceae bacterium]